MPAMDWIRNERFVELWGEGLRYYDARRWMIAPEVFAAGVRKGLNMEQVETTSKDITQETTAKKTKDTKKTRGTAETRNS
jgi:hypothetical protein